MVRLFPFLAPEDMTHLEGFVGGDAVDSEADHFLYRLFLVNRPDVDAHLFIVGFLNPSRVLLEDPVVVVDAVDTLCEDLLRGDVP